MDVKILLGAHVFISSVYPGSLIFLCLSRHGHYSQENHRQKVAGWGPWKAPSFGETDLLLFSHLLLGKEGVCWKQKEGLGGSWRPVPLRVIGWWCPFGLTQPRTEFGVWTLESACLR